MEGGMVLLEVGSLSQQIVSYLEEGLRALEKIIRDVEGALNGL
jgi:hypothetical protein